MLVSVCTYNSNIVSRFYMFLLIFYHAKLFTHTSFEHGKITAWQLISSQSCCLLSRLSMVLFGVYGEICGKTLCF